MGTIWPQVPGFDCTNAVIFKRISNQKVPHGEYGLCPMMSAYLLVARIPEQPLDKGQNGSESFHTNSACQLRALSALSLSLEVPVLYKPRLDVERLGGEEFWYQKHDGERARDFFYSFIFWKIV